MLSEKELNKLNLTSEPLNRSKTPELDNQLMQLRIQLERPNKNTIKKLEKLIKKYPENLQLKNFLVIGYAKTGEKALASAYNEQILAEHPDYFFAKIHKSMDYNENGEFEKIPEIMGSDFDLEKLYPEREIFHISEFLSMQLIAVYYLISQNDLGNAKKRIEKMRFVDEDSQQYEMAQNLFMRNQFDASIRQMEIDGKNRTQPKVTFNPSQKSFIRPTPNFPETHLLNDELFEILDDTLPAFLESDRTLLVEDLENALRESYLTYNSETSNEIDEIKKGYLGINSLLLLTHIESVESLPVILDMMTQDQTYFDNIIGSFFLQYGWQILCNLGKDRLDLLHDFLQQPGRLVDFRIAVCEALLQIQIYYPEKRDEVRAIYKSMLELFNNSIPEDNIIDSELAGFLISDIVDMRDETLLPLIKSLYDKNHVSLSVCGNYDEVVRQFKLPLSDNHAKRHLSESSELLDEFLSELISDEFEDKFEDDDDHIHDDRDFNFFKNLMYKNPEKTVGRNDPCPCGSGKKYKKCCLNK